MPVEGDFDNIDSLDPTFPFNDDPVAEGPQHLRGIKNALQGNVQGDDTFSALLVNAIQKLIADADGVVIEDGSLDVRGQTIEVNQLAASMVAELKLQNVTGGWGWLNQADSSELLLLQFSIAGALEKVAAQFDRDGAFSASFNGLAAFATIDPTRNSSAEVRDFNGGQHPIGYNTLPPLIISGNTALAALHNGKLLQITNNITLTLAVPFQGFAFNVICAAAVGDIAVPAGQTVFLYEGFQRRNFVGPATLSLNLGSALTFVQNTGTSWNAWGGDVA